MLLRREVTGQEFLCEDGPTMVHSSHPVVFPIEDEVIDSFVVLISQDKSFQMLGPEGK